MTELLLFGISLAIIYAAAKRMILANRTYQRSVKEIELLAAIPVELAKNKKGLEKKLADQIDQISRSRGRIEQLKGEKVQLEDELKKLKARPKDNLFVMERVMQPGQTLWEIILSNDSYFRDNPHEEFRNSWAHGRKYVVSAPSERDARRRAELKFLSSQGYRILQVQKSTRF